jgi:hypothetical protein
MQTTDRMMSTEESRAAIGFSPVSRMQGRGVHVTGVSAAYTFKLNKNILSE